MEGSALAFRGVGPPSTHPILVHIPLITPQPPSAASPKRKCCKFCLQWYFWCELFVFYSGSKFCPGWGYRTWYLPCIRSFNKSKLPRITPQGKVPQAAQTEGFLLVVLAGGLGRAGSSLQAVLLCCSQGYLQQGHILSPHFLLKGLVMYKNYSDVFSDSVFSPSLLSESRMLYFWLSEHILNSLASAAFLDERLVMNISGKKLQVTFRGGSLLTIA